MSNNSNVIDNGTMETIFGIRFRDSLEAYWEKRGRIPYDGRPNQTERWFQGLAASERSVVEGK